MRKFWFFGALAAFFGIMGVAPVFAQYPQYEGPWCAHMSLGKDFVENKCTMRSYEMCRAEIAGTPGAWCTQNPWYVPSSAAPRSRKAVPQRYR